MLDPDCLSTARWAAVLFVCSLCVALAVFGCWTRGVFVGGRGGGGASAAILVAAVGVVGDAVQSLLCSHRHDCSGGY